LAKGNCKKLSAYNVADVDCSLLAFYGSFFVVQNLKNMTRLLLSLDEALNGSFGVCGLEWQKHVPEKKF
jgi:hypothetical protein